MTKKRMTQARKAEAWRVAAKTLTSWSESLPGKSDVWEHILDTVVPSLRRKAEIIDRRQTHAKREARRRRKDPTGLRSLTRSKKGREALAGLLKLGRAMTDAAVDKAEGVIPSPWPLTGGVLPGPCSCHEPGGRMLCPTHGPSYGSGVRQ
jgi:hypothetical protein